MSGHGAGGGMVLSWDEEFDIVVAGFGGAGACAAIEAADRGARVVVIERFSGGGATARSGGVIYAGGGSRIQRAAGFRDSVELMCRYLARETGNRLAPAHLRAFTDASADSLAWLEGLGVSIPDRFYPEKTTQPPSGFGLYFSGNERQYASGDPPVPRGHVPSGAGMSGPLLFEALRRAAMQRGIEVRYRCRPRRLIIEGGAVTGVETVSINGNSILRLLHRLLFNIGFVSGFCRSLVTAIENAFGVRSRICARGGVVICTGGFIYNREMLRSLAPRYAGCMPLGTPGDDGAGILLGVSAGGDVEAMNSCAASRFYAPPEAFVSGVLVNAEGRRFCDESLYGATISRHISAQHGGRAWLIIDGGMLREAREQMRREERLRDRPFRHILSGEMNYLIFRKTMAFVNMRVNRTKAESLRDLAARCRIPAAALSETVEAYNRCCGVGGDEFGKEEKYLKPLDEPPYYAINCRLDSRVFPSPCITLGGLRVEGHTARVLRSDGSAVPGLYAAGRSAAGICAHSYVSGLSLADCIFSGRTAGRSAAARAAGNQKNETIKRRY